MKTGSIPHPIRSILILIASMTLCASASGARAQETTSTLTTSTLVKEIIAAAAESPVPAIHGARVVGATPGRPFLFRIPATGEGPLTFAATGLPEGLELDAKSGILRGALRREGTTTATLSVSGPKGRASRKLAIIGGWRKLALTPPMGWNSWNIWGKEITAGRIREAADALERSGLAAHGYAYINIDDGWADGRDASGRIRPNKRFGDMNALADYVHAKGLKLGIYSSPGPETCAGFEGSYRHEVADAATFAEWGIDYLKYDWCSYQQIWDKEEASRPRPYATMREALDLVGRDIIYSICQYGEGQVWKWGGTRDVGGNLWRTTGDIKDTWLSMSVIGFSESTHAPYSGPGRWNDPDMLVLGKLGWGDAPRPTGLTPDEQLTHISLWHLLAAPLLIGCDLTDLDPFTRALLTNDEAIAVNQDPLGRQAVRVDRQGGGGEVWARPLADGGQAVGLFNRGKETRTVRAEWSKLGLGGRQRVRDLWRRKELGEFESGWSAEIPSHGAALIKVGGARE